MKCLFRFFWGNLYKDDAAKRSKRILFLALGLLPAFGFISIVLASYNFIYKYGLNSTDYGSYIVAIGYGLLIAGAAYLGGGFTGFLFGLPRPSDDRSSDKNDDKSKYARNNNLGQVSDWVTKIIVGLGLTNLYSMPSQLGRFGNHYGFLFGKYGDLIAESILVYYSISGFLLGYLWTNINYILILTDADTQADDLADKEKRALKAGEMTEKLTKQAKERVAASDTRAAYEAVKALYSTATNNTENAEVMGFEDFGSMIALADKRMQDGLKAQNNLKLEDADPNKGRFGGLRDHDGKRIDASITTTSTPGLFKVTISVMGTAAENKLQDGEVVVFALHPTFPEPVMVVMVKDGMATVEVIAWGAFTVGAVCNKGNVLLEYDLSTLPGAPKEFLEN